MFSALVGEDAMWLIANGDREDDLLLGQPNVQLILGFTRSRNQLQLDPGDF